MGLQEGQGLIGLQNILTLGNPAVLKMLLINLHLAQNRFILIQEK